MSIVNEQILTGRKFRKMIDEATKLWLRISFWTKASDVEFDDGMTAETKMGSIDGITDSLVGTSSRVAASAKAVATLNENLKASFQAGVDVLHGKCTELGFTPAGKTPSNISDTISKIYTDRYNSGYTNGRTQGQNDVIANPTGYGINAGGIINNQFGRIGWKRLRSSFGAGSHTILWTYKVHGKYIPEFEVRNITTNSQIWHFKPNEGEGDEPAIVSDWSFNLSSPAVLELSVYGSQSNGGMSFGAATLI